MHEAVRPLISGWDAVHEATVARGRLGCLVNACTTLAPNHPSTVQVETCIVHLSGVCITDAQMYEGLHPIDWSDVSSIKRALLVGTVLNSQSAAHSTAPTQVTC